jgi:hypothetical protein
LSITIHIRHLTPFKYGQTLRRLGPQTWLKVSKIEVRIKGIEIVFGLKANQR